MSLFSLYGHRNRLLSELLSVLFPGSKLPRTVCVLVSLWVGMFVSLFKGVVSPV